MGRRKFTIIPLGVFCILAMQAEAAPIFAGPIPVSGIGNWSCDIQDATFLLNVRFSGSSAADEIFATISGQPGFVCQGPGNVVSGSTRIGLPNNSFIVNGSSVSGASQVTFQLGDGTGLLLFFDRNRAVIASVSLVSYISDVELDPRFTDSAHGVFDGNFLISPEQPAPEPGAGGLLLAGAAVLACLKLRYLFVCIRTLFHL